MNNVMNQTAENIKELNERINRESAFIDLVNNEMSKVIVGQKQLTEGLLIGLLSNGHVLLEGVPGLAKIWQSKPCRKLSNPNSTVFSSLPTFCLPTCSVL